MEIVWTDQTEAILRQIRARAPSPGAFFAFEDEIVIVTSARATDTFPRVLLPGEACVTVEGAVVRTGDGAIVLLGGEVDEEPADADMLAHLFGGDVAD